MILFTTFFLSLISSLHADFHQTYTYSLYDSYIYADFKGYSYGVFTLSGNNWGSVVDFWIVDEDGFEQWDSSSTPMTAKLFTGTFCNDCFTFTVTFTLPSSSAKYYFVLANLEPSDATGSLSVDMYGNGEFSDLSEESDKTCFAGDSLIHLKNGSSIPIKYAQIGDEILASTYSGELIYSPIIAIPHPLDNSLRGKMLTLTIQSHETNQVVNLTLSHDHLLPTCQQIDCSLCSTNLLLPSSLTSSQDIQPNMCLLTMTSSSSQWNKVISITQPHLSKGMYSIVTLAPYPVINGIVSSPFGYSHLLPSLFYTIHSLVYRLGFMKYSDVQVALNTMNDQMTKLLSYKFIHESLAFISK